MLITLTIIGVIAALTLPNLYTKYEKQQTITGLKKSFSTLSQAFALARIEYGTDWNIFNLSDLDIANKYIIPYLKVEKVYNDTKTKPCTAYAGEQLAIWLQDGTCLGVSAQDNSTTFKGIYLYVDINGKKEPNKSGIDRFILYYAYEHSNFLKWKHQLIPFEMNQTRDKTSCKPGAGPYGTLGCANFIIKDNWQIKDDYPWDWLKSQK